VPFVALQRPTCGRADVPCVCVADVRWGAQLADVPCVALGSPTCGRALCCIWAPILRTCLALRWSAQPWGGRIKNSTSKTKICSYPSSSSSFSLVLPCVDVFVADEFYVWVTILWTCLSLRWGAQLADVRTYLAFALRTCVGVPNLRMCLALHWGTQPW
jgi:hypothetical protein